MRLPPPGGRLGSRVAAVLRTGTLVAVATVSAGYLIVLLAGDDGPGARPVLDLVSGGGPDALVTLGLLALTLLPLVVLGVAAATFAGRGERRYLIASSVTLVLLAGSLVVAALVTGSG